MGSINGGSEFIANQLAERSLEHNELFTFFNLIWNALHTHPLRDHQNIKLCVCDFMDAAALESVMAGSDYVVDPREPKR